MSRDVSPGRRTRQATRWVTLLTAIAVPTLAHCGSFLMDGPTGSEVALTYAYVRSNAPPGECPCFSMNGAGISFAKPFAEGNWAAVFDATATHASRIAAGDYDLTLAVFTVGARYRPWPDSHWSPFGEVLIGASHASGSLVEGNTPAAFDGSFKFASNVGGGLDYWINDQWSIRVLQADYLLTTYSNRTNDHQNNLRLGVGAAFHFGAR
jgi:peptidoglycan-associated lipoprotein